MKRSSTNLNAHVHLLRNVDNAKALRENALVAHLFVSVVEGEARTAYDLQTLDLIRRTIDKCCDVWLKSFNARARMHALRQVHILRRCDLEGELHTVVARELGLSMRHFYRERSQAIDAIVGLAAERFALMAAPALAAVDPFALEVARLHAMLLSGLHDAAVGRARQVMAELTDVNRRAEIAALAAHTLVDEGLIEPARELLEEFRETGRRGVHGVDALRQRARWALVKAELHDRCGQVGGLRGATEEAARIAEQLSLAPQTPERDEVLVRIHIARAHKYLTEHDAPSAETALRHAGRILELSRNPPAHLTVDYHLGVAELGPVSGDLAIAHGAAGSALETANRHGYVRGAFGALIIFTYLAFQGGDRRRAIGLVQRAMEVSRAVPRFFEGVAHLTWASIEAESGRDAGEVIRHARAAREALPQRGGSDWAISFAIEAYGLEMSGAHEDAIRLGEEALRLQRRSGDVRFLGSTLRVMAESYDRLRRPRDAVVSIEEAVELAKSYAHPISLGRTYSVAAKITGDRSFAQAANELAINMTSA